MEQRYVPLAFTAGATHVTATAPANANVAPPGPYMLVIVDDKGVPSVAKMVTVTDPPTAAITSPANGSAFPWRSSIIIRAAAADPGGQVTNVVFRDGANVLGQDTTAPYSFTWRNLRAGTHVVTARATDNDGVATTSAPVGITVRRTR
jgi:hypothetical protein